MSAQYVMLLAVHVQDFQLPANLATQVSIFTWIAVFHHVQQVTLLLIQLNNVFYVRQVA